MGDEAAVRGPPDEGVYVHGLFLDGAAWSAKEGKLVDAAPKVGGLRWLHDCELAFLRQWVASCMQRGLHPDSALSSPLPLAPL